MISRTSLCKLRCLAPFYLHPPILSRSRRPRWLPLKIMIVPPKFPTAMTDLRRPDVADAEVVSGESPEAVPEEEEAEVVEVNGVVTTGRKKLAALNGGMSSVPSPLYHLD